MRMLARKLFPVCVAAILVGCADGPVEYAADNSGGILHQISTDPAEIFRNKVDHEAALARWSADISAAGQDFRELRGANLVLLL